MVKIIVDKKLLEEKLAQVKDGDLVELAFVPPQNDHGDYSPAFLHLAAIHSEGIYEDLESIDEFVFDLCTQESA